MDLIFLSHSHGEVIARDVGKPSKPVAIAEAVPACRPALVTPHRQLNSISNIHGDRRPRPQRQLGFTIGNPVGRDIVKD